LNRIKLDLDRTLGPIDRNIFGGFVEHLGRSVYGGIYDPESPLSDEHGLRSDLRAALDRLGLTNIRYPGGNFVSGYRWRDGVGPVEDRPRRTELAWASVEPNTFGTNEFVRFCRAIGAEPYLVVNSGDGDLREARDWVEYCNGTADTILVRERTAHGFPDPHRVRFWGIGNEVDGDWQIGAKTGQEYARAYREYAKVMRWTDPTIQLIASGTSDWDGDIVERTTLLVEEAGDLIDYLSIHWYVGDRAGDTKAYLATSELIEARLSAHEGLMRGLTLGKGKAPRRPIPLAVDEWNVWYRATGGPTQPKERPLEEVYDLQDALVVAMHLNAFIRHASTVRMANIAQLVNVIAPILTSPDGIVLQTIFHPYELFSRITGSVALDAWWEGDTFAGGDHKAVRTLDVAASLDPDRRRLSVQVVNRHETDALDTVFELANGPFGGQLQIATITGPDFKVTNTPEQPDCVRTTEETLEISPTSTYHHAVPPRSVTGLVFSL
jgi:alpha-N-arabinofuranosidase